MFATGPFAILGTGVEFQPVESNLRASFRILAGDRPRGEVREIGGISIASAGVTFQMFNAAFLILVEFLQVSRGRDQPLVSVPLSHAGTTVIESLHLHWLLVQAPLAVPLLLDRCEVSPDLTVRDARWPLAVFVVFVILTVWELSMKAVAIMYAIHRISVMAGSLSIISR